jgi:hypothetical protein
MKHNHNQMLKKSEAIITQGKKLPVEERIEKRIEKFGKMGFWEEMETDSATGQ